MLIRVFIALLLPTIALSQDLSGKWAGRLVMAPTGCFPVYTIQFELTDSAGIITGTALHYSDSFNYIKKNIVGSFSKDSNRLLLEENSLLAVNLKQDCVPCLKKYTLTYHRGGIAIADEQIRGTWISPADKATDGKTNCDPGTIVLNRVTKLERKNVSPALTQTKTNVLVREIKLDSCTIEIELFDNGQIDKDTVSVYVNNRPVVYHQMLKAQPIPIRLSIHAKKNIQEVVMVGENLGTIPPNTALMIIKAGEQRYQLYLAADEKRNALVRFIYEPTH
ncbi:MAG: hypothetical protein FJY19_04190 [Bacteroidetes bacterium]|nr:hypothetical protein [Bacteroidota bacterium]